ncbi:hypothetical protein [Streptomyces sp. MBT33]|uniref:hypothetical protein n=1 Tax=Streptomyces sp. MBT33 TaxID=1488363 RepID=UPI00190C97B8|nr:hypothetical protein [Streptomyces sp. MBT33]MBK3642117.1 hypothetical protein [Streptomyces sp. MBT33]
MAVNAACLLSRGQAQEERPHVVFLVPVAAEHRLNRSGDGVTRLRLRLLPPQESVQSTRPHPAGAGPAGAHLGEPERTLRGVQVAEVAGELLPSNEAAYLVRTSA